MSKHYLADFEMLVAQQRAMEELTTSLVSAAVAFLLSDTPVLLAEWSEWEDAVDRFDVLVEEQCLRMIAVHQPVAADLRRITAVWRIAGELERIADLATNIIERTTALSATRIQRPDSLALLATGANEQLRRSLAAFDRQDSLAARQICAADSNLDDQFRATAQFLAAEMQASPTQIDPAMDLFCCARLLERVGDHATNIAEEAIYVSEGFVCRNRPSAASAAA